MEMIERSEIYKVIDGERDYQDIRWNANTTTSGGVHSVTEFALFMDDYMAQMKHELSRNGNPKAIDLALDTLRKIVAMGIACMEQNGVRPRAENA